MSASPARGRNARSKRTRAAIVDAYLELLKEGLAPASGEIAERAGVTQRTLFNQFGDMRSVISEAGRCQFEHIEERLPVVAARGPLQQRVAEYVAGLAPLLEDVSPVRWMVFREHELEPYSRTILDRIRQLMLGRLAEVVDPELGALEDGGREETLHALEIATDPLTWRLMRVQQGLDVETATRVMTRTVVGLVRDRRAPLAVVRSD